LGRSDLPAVAELMAARLPGWDQDESFLAETLLNQRWTTAELPSLVSVGDDGALHGFIGAQVRRFRLDGRELRGVCCSHLVAVEGPGAAGALLLRRMLSGEQDLTWTDTATDEVARMWQTFGGQIDHARALDWMLVLKPVGWVRRMLTSGLRRRGSVRELAPARAIPLRALVPRSGEERADVSAGIDGVDATASALAANIDEIARDTRLHVDYDEPVLDRLFTRIEATAGPLVRRLVRQRGTTVGWYAYLSRPGGTSRVLHLCGHTGALEAVTQDLIDDAHRRGSVALAGRYEPFLRAALFPRSPAFGFARLPMIHSRDPEVISLLATNSSILTQLDGEWFAA
jgi:hypothetical protein